MEKTTIDIPQSRFIKLESMVQELLEQTKEKKETTKPKQVYTPEMFCDFFDLSRSTFDRLKKEGKIKCTKIGRRVYIEAKEVDRLKSFGL